MDLKKTITFDAGGHEYDVPVSFRIIEIAENVYQVGADSIVTMLVNPHTIRRTQLAQVLSQWIGPGDIPKGTKRSEIYQAILTAPAEKIGVYAGCIQGAICFALGYIDEDQLGALSSGKDLEDEPVGNGDAGGS